MKINFRLISVIAAALLFVFVAACGMGRDSGSKPAANAGSSTAGNSTGSSTSAPAVPTNISGKYNVTGTNPNGAAYKGTLEVIAQGDVYQFRWNAGEQYDGVGIQNGNVVAVSFTGGENGEGCGVVDYVIKDDGVLDGKWGFWGVNESGNEKAARISGGSGLEGEYDAIGKDPKGKDYKTKLSVEAAGSLYRFSWSNGDSGIGVKQGDNVAVGIGGTRCGFVAYQIKPDGSLDGIWGGYGTDKTGTEKATK